MYFSSKVVACSQHTSVPHRLTSKVVACSQHVPLYPTDSSPLYPLLESVHTPYCQLLVQYPTVEGQLMTERLKEVQLVRKISLGRAVTLKKVAKW